MHSIPARPEDITLSWLSAVLSPAGWTLTDIPAPPTRIGADYGFTSEIYRVPITGSYSRAAADGPTSVVVKLWPTDGRAGLREVSFFESFGDDPGIRIPICYHGEVDTVAGRGVLVLEDIRGGTQGDCLHTLTPREAESFARDLARFHARWRGSPRLDEHEWLPTLYRAPRGEEWFGPRRDEFFRRFGTRVLPECRPFLDAAVELEAAAHELLSEVPGTLVHADLHLDNLIFGVEGQTVVLDWANASRGPGVLELCDVMLMTDPDAQPAVVEAYSRESRDGGGAYSLESRDGGNPNVRELFRSGSRTYRAVSGAMLRKFLSWTFGMARWHPTSERARALQDLEIYRAQEALIGWSERDPETFAKLGKP